MEQHFQVCLHTALDDRIPDGVYFDNLFEALRAA